MVKGHKLLIFGAYLQCENFSQGRIVFIQHCVQLLWIIGRTHLLAYLA